MAPAPPTVIPVTLNATLPVLPTLNVAVPDDPTFTLPVESAGVESEIPTVVWTVPLNVKAEGLPAALWAIDNVADLAPVDVGENVTVTTCASAPAFTVNVAGLTVN